MGRLQNEKAQREGWAWGCLGFCERADLRRSFVRIQASLSSHFIHNALNQKAERDSQQ